MCVCACADSLTRLETDQKAHSSNYTGGEKTGKNWTDKVFGAKSTQEVPEKLPQDQQDGVDEEEWVSSLTEPLSVLLQYLVVARNF